MIKLKQLLESHGTRLPDPSLGQYILENKVVSMTDWLYHGSPLEGLKSIIINGVWGTEHGEVAEYDTLSTSLNSEVLVLFSEGEGETGIQFEVKNANIVVLDDILTYLVTQLPGSGFDAEVDDEEEFERFCERFNVPTDNWKGTPYLPYNYLSSLGVDGFMFDYVYQRWSGGMSAGIRDESEIAFIGKKGLNKLNESISGIYVYGQEYTPEQKTEALEDIEGRL